MPGILDRLRTSSRAGQQPAGQQQQQERPPFVPLRGARLKPSSIEQGEFDAGRSYVASREFQLATYTIPRNEVVQFRRLPARLWLQSRATGAGTNDAATTEQIDLGSAGINAVRTVRAEPTLPSMRHPDVRAYTSTDGGSTWVQQNITAYDAPNNTVTIEKPASTAYDYRIYVTTANGQVRIMALAPAGSGAVEVQLLNKTLGALHEMDQARDNSALVLPRQFGREIRLSQKFSVGIYVKTDVEMVWSEDDQPAHEIVFPVDRRAVRVLDAQATVRSTLQQLGV